MKGYLAVDIGASSGRVMLGQLLAKQGDGQNDGQNNGRYGKENVEQSAGQGDWPESDLESGLKNGSDSASKLASESVSASTSKSNSEDDQKANHKIVLTELHRFKNGAQQVGAYKVWDVDGLLENIVIGLEKAQQAGVTECTLGIDTWGVDYCLLDAAGQRIGPAIAYRDDRTEDAVALLQQKIALAEVYEKTGIQVQPFNTLFQLLVEAPARLGQAESLLFMPDYLNYCLTGVKACERTIASTSQLLNLETGEFDAELLALLGIPAKLFPPLVEPGTVLGPLQAEKFPGRDLPNVQVVAVTEHDTAAAVLATPGQTNAQGQNDWAFLSSGTWSLLGSENAGPLVSAASFAANYSNEEGHHHTYRFLKNIMGMWLIQEVAHDFDSAFSFAELVTLAAAEPPFAQFIDVNDPAFLHPKNMIGAIQTYCRQTAQCVPETPGTLARAIYDNLALCYACELEKLTALVGHPLTARNIVGGGSQNAFLNQLTADVSGYTVLAGPVEATALGNIATQMMTAGAVASVASVRALMARSFPLKVFTPRNDYAKRFADYKNFIQKRSKQ